MAKDSAIKIIQVLLNQKNTPVSALTIKEFVETHPEPLTLGCINDFFTYVNGDCILIKGSIDEVTSSSDYMICIVKRSIWEFVLIKNCSSSCVILLDSKGVEHNYKREEFDKIAKQDSYLKIIDNGIIDPKYSQNQTEEFILNIKNNLIFISLSAMLAYSIYLAIFSKYNSFAISKIIGVLVCFLILTVQFKGGNSFTKKMCNISANTSCESVLFSPSSKVFGYIGWSEIGFVYFCSGWLVSVFMNENLNATLIQCAISLLAFPYIFYSLYYQFFVLRRLCPLCLAVQLILFIEAAYSIIILYNNSLISISFSLDYGIVIILAYILSSCIYTIAKPAIENHVEANYKDRVINSFKYDSTIFSKKLKQQSTCPTWRPSKLIGFGNAEPIIKIDLFINPFCSACALAYSQMKMLSSYNLGVHVNILFSTTNNKNDIRYIACKELLYIYSKEIDMQVLDYWFSVNRDYDLFERKFKKELALLDEFFIEESLNQHQEWENELEIHGSPRLFVNGFLLPNFYEAKDLFVILKKSIQ